MNTVKARVYRKLTYVDVTNYDDAVKTYIQGIPEWRIHVLDIEKNVIVWELSMGFPSWRQAFDSAYRWVNYRQRIVA
ncbi:MAG: hypothetical protein M0R06_11765 [Sphaerochaeta sp.]|jgi:hypothetical protein|nr:hypothetical protein [Sphaerochaeta sp.]